MADIRRLTDSLSVAPQLTASDIALVDQMQFRSILCNRPDHEEENQPLYDEIKKQADALGIAIEFQPVNGSQINDEDVERFYQHVQDLPAPVLAYCRSGTRCTVLWALGQAGSQDEEEILSTAAAAGYSLESLRERLAERVRQSGGNA